MRPAPLPPEWQLKLQGEPLTTPVPWWMARLARWRRRRTSARRAPRARRAMRGLRDHTVAALCRVVGRKARTRAGLANARGHGGGRRQRMGSYDFERHGVCVGACACPSVWACVCVCACVSLCACVHHRANAFFLMRSQVLGLLRQDVEQVQQLRAAHEAGRQHAHAAALPSVRYRPRPPSRRATCAVQSTPVGQCARKSQHTVSPLLCSTRLGPAILKVSTGGIPGRDRGAYPENFQDCGAYRTRR